MRQAAGLEIQPAPSQDPAWALLRVAALVGLGYYAGARNANPLATEVNSSPVRMFPPPKRRSNIARTAGTKDEPPVRNTRSASR